MSQRETELQQLLETYRTSINEKEQKNRFLLYFTAGLALLTFILMDVT
jgi:hypothetical protein